MEDHNFYKRKKIQLTINNSNVDNKIITNIITYIKSNNIEYTENNNGIFINLSILHDPHIHNIYNIAFSLPDNIIYSDNDIYNLCSINDLITPDKCTSNTNIKDNITLSKLDKLIINDSMHL